MKKHIPNIMTIARLVLTGVMFIAMILEAAAMRERSGLPAAHILLSIMTVTFAIAAITDFLDGYLARKWQVVSTAGAILDPIADKILVAGAILGLLGLGVGSVLIPGALILFREFAVSAMREVLAPKGLKLPVTQLAKAKTTVQLVALGAIMVLLTWQNWPGATPPAQGLVTGAQVLFLFAAVVTLWTGGEYAIEAHRALKEKSDEKS